MIYFRLMTFREKLSASWAKNNSLLCVGLDPDHERLPAGRSQFEFNKAIIDATHDLVCCYKPNSAFYEALGSEGVEQLKLTCHYLQENYPDTPVLLDYKRGDIGNTNRGYAEFAFHYLKADAITLQPYQGGQALQPFFDYEDKGIFILVKTSNEGSGEFQNLVLDGRPLYEHVTETAMKSWNKNGNIMVVAGATYPKELERIRELVGQETPILVPGMGAQGGDTEAIMKAGMNENHAGLIINSSREILYASSGEDFSEAARQKAEQTRNEINKYR